MRGHEAARVREGRADCPQSLRPRRTQVEWRPLSKQWGIAGDERAHGSIAEGPQVGYGVLVLSAEAEICLARF